MLEQLSYLITAKMSLLHLNVLFLLGLAVFGGAIGGRIFQKLRIPQVVGYIAIGILIGESGFKIVSHDIIEKLQPLNYFALGLIGFMVGGELKRDILVKYGKRLITILLCEGIAPFIFVSIAIGCIGSFIFDWKTGWALGLLFGAIAIATDPATTTEVFKEYRTRGPVTTTAIGIVALDDGLALILFALASSIAGSLSGHGHTGLIKTFIHPLYDIIGSMILGGVSGFVLSRILRKYADSARLLAFAIGMVLIVTGLALVYNVELLLAAMTVGIIVVNFTPRKSKEVFQLVGGFTPPIYVLFFVLIGANLNLRHLNTATLLLVVIYLVCTMAGKIVGARIGTRISGAPKTVQRYLPLTLFSQAGVAIGLSILAAQYFPGQIGATLVIVITATTFVLQLIGPAITKFAVTQAGEVGLNITEEDLVTETKVRDMMEAHPAIIHKDDTLAKIIKIFSANSNLYYPVVDDKNAIRGIISVDSIKQTVLEMDAGNLILADDLMEPYTMTITPDSSVADAKELMEKHNLEYLPVVNEQSEIAGFIERRLLSKAISTKMVELQRKADSFESS